MAKVTQLISGRAGDQPRLPDPWPLIPQHYSDCSSRRNKNQRGKTVQDVMGACRAGLPAPRSPGFQATLVAPTIPTLESRQICYSYHHPCLTMDPVQKHQHSRQDSCLCNSGPRYSVDTYSHPLRGSGITAKEEGRTSVRARQLRRASGSP